MTQRAAGAAALIIEAALLAALLIATVPLGAISAPADSYAGAFLTPSDWDHPALPALRWAAWLLLAALLTGAWLSVARSQLTARPAKSPDLPGPAGDDAPVQRFDAHQRLQHIVLLSSVAMLALTGLPQAFPDAPGAATALALWGGPAAARTVHRIAAACSDFAVLYHLAYLALLALRRGVLPLGLLPGRAAQHSSAATRFTASHKADYWTAAILLPVQTATGLALVHADMAVAAAPPWVLAATLAVHRTAAVALVGYIIVVHLYHAALDRAVYPLNTAIFTGSLRRRSYQALFAAEEQAEAPAASGRRAAPRPSAAAQERP